MPLARQVVKDLAAEHGACLRPVQLRRTEIDTGHVEQVLIPCGHTLASVCPSCAERARILRAAQCREGWHLDHEPVIDPDPATEDQRAADHRPGRGARRPGPAGQRRPRYRRAGRADRRTGRGDHRFRAPRPGAARAAAPPPLHPAAAGRRSPAPPPGQRPDGRQDLHHAGRQDLPAVAVRHARRARRTAGSARTEHPPTRTPTTTPRAARDALHFAALFDRFIQNLRRFTGYDLQYFAAIEPQRRLAPHIHLAIRGTISRARAPRGHRRHLPPGLVAINRDRQVRRRRTCRSGTSTPAPTSTRTPARSCRPGTRPSTPSATQDEPRHVARFGARFDAQGVLAGSRDASRCIGYLTKYLTKHLGDCHQADHRRPGRPRRPARRRPAVRAVLADLRELAPLRHPAQERPARPAARAPARARPTAANTSATPDAASWSPASGPARPWPTTAPTGGPG